jgi:hypothetical protein
MRDAYDDSRTTAKSEKVIYTYLYVIIWYFKIKKNKNESRYINIAGYHDGHLCGFIRQVWYRRI